ncbi:MAG: hypothetical protein V4542_03970 [Pseudomonadota bacterium]
MRKLISYYLPVVLLMGCGDGGKQINESDFTLGKGVSVLKLEGCTKSGLSKDITIKKDSEAYVIVIEGAFSCETEQLKPYLTLPINRRATLVIPQKATSAVFKSNCECNRSLSIRLEGRVERGDNVYVLNNSEVLGHVVVP